MSAPRIHRFESTHEAYNATQTDDSIHHGDVLVVAPERVFGVLIRAWPVALSFPAETGPGAFHTLSPAGDAEHAELIAAAFKAAGRPMVRKGERS